MSSRDRLRHATEEGILPPDSLRAALGAIGTTATDKLSATDGVQPRSGERTMRQFEAGLEQTFATAHQLYAERLGLNVPTLAQLEGAGYDRSELANVYETMHFDGLQPEIVLAPELDIFMSNKLAESLKRDTTLTKQRSFGGLTIDDNIPQQAWGRYVRLRPEKQPYLQHKNKRWTIAVLTGRYAPDHRNVAYDIINETLPNISQLLALHFQHIQSGQSMVDGTRRDALDLVSRARGEDNISNAPVVTWNESSSYLAVYLLSKSATYPWLGTRQPRWSIK